MPRSRHVNHVQVVLINQPVGVGPDKGLTWTTSPVTEQTVFDVLGAKRLLEQGIVLQINHADGEVIRCSPVGIKSL